METDRRHGGEGGAELRGREGQARRVVEGAWVSVTRPQKNETSRPPSNAPARAAAPISKGSNRVDRISPASGAPTPFNFSSKTSNSSFERYPRRVAECKHCQTS